MFYHRASTLIVALINEQYVPIGINDLNKAVQVALYILRAITSGDSNGNMRKRVRHLSSPDEQQYQVHLNHVLVVRQASS